MSDQLLALACVIVLGVGAQWLAWRIRVASILLLLLVGFLAGPVSAKLLGRPLIDPNEIFKDLLEPIVALAVALILYEGGLTLRLAELRETREIVWRLVSVGAFVTWGLAAAAGRLILDLEWSIAILLGAILVVTGPTVIIPLLRQIRPSGRIGAVMRWEGIVIDPIGAMLAVLVFEVILLGNLEEAAGHAISVVLRTIVVGGGLGFAAGLVLALVLRWFWVPDFLENAVSIMFVVGVYTASQAIQNESGLFAATAMGVTLANQKFVDVKHIVEFKENLRVLLISSLFILLAARLRLEDFDDIGLSALFFLAVLIVVVRPISVLLSTIGTSFTRREAIFAAFMAPRGIVAAAVASVFALRLHDERALDATMLVPLTFMVIIGTVLVYSVMAPIIAHRLGLADPHPQGVLFVGAHNWGRAVAETLQKLDYRVLLIDTNRADLAAARMAGIPTCNESILAEQLLDEIDLGGLGRLIAATPNDWVNILAVHRFVRVFGRGEVYQVAARRGEESSDDSHRHLHGRWLFDGELTFADLSMRVREGAVIKTTTLSETFTLESFRAHYGSTAIPLFVMSETGRLDVVTAGSELDAEAGDTLISLVGPETPDSQRSEPDSAPFDAESDEGDSR